MHDYGIKKINGKWWVTKFSRISEIKYQEKIKRPAPEPVYLAESQQDAQQKAEQLRQQHPTEHRITCHAMPKPTTKRIGNN